MALEDLYNRRLAKGWDPSAMAQELVAAVADAAGCDARRLQQHWLRTEPDGWWVDHRALYDSLVTVLPGVLYVTVLTDLADYPPNPGSSPAAALHMRQRGRSLTGAARWATAMQVHRTPE